VKDLPFLATHIHLGCLDGRAHGCDVGDPQSDHAFARIGQCVVDHQHVERHLVVIAGEDQRAVAIGQRDAVSERHHAIAQNLDSARPGGSGQRDVGGMIAVFQCAADGRAVDLHGNRGVIGTGEGGQMGNADTNGGRSFLCADDADAQH